METENGTDIEQQLRADVSASASSNIASAVGSEASSEESSAETEDSTLDSETESDTEALRTSGDEEDTTDESDSAEETEPTLEEDQPQPRWRRVRPTRMVSLTGSPFPAKRLRLLRPPQPALTPVRSSVTCHILLW